MSDDLIRDLARAKVAFQLRAIVAAAGLCAKAQSKPDQETARLPQPPEVTE